MAWADQIILCIASFSFALFLLYVFKNGSSRPRPPGPPGWPLMGNIFDMGLMPFAIFLPLFLFFFMLFKLAITGFRRNPSSLKLPPGPRKLPLIGNLHNLASGAASSSSLPHHILRDLAAKYGPVMHLQLGEIPTVVISSAEAAKEVTKTHDLAFAGRPSILAADKLFYGQTDIAFAPYGAHWRQMRRITTLQILSNKRVQSIRHIIEAESMNLCRWIASKEGSPIDLAEKIVSTTYDIICRSSLGQKTKEQEAFLSVLREGLDALGGFRIADLYPSVKLLHVISGMKRRLESLHKESDTILEKIIQQRYLASTTKNSSRDEDVLDVLLNLLQDSHDDLELPLTMDNIKAVILDLFFAGSDTTATTVDWAMTEMLKDGEVLNKAQYEVRRVFDGKDGRVDESCLNELNYLKLVIKETLRMHPPIPLVPRECRESSEIFGYHIPAKTQVMVNVWAIGRDPKYWENAHSFMPDRFLQDCGTVDLKGNHDFYYIPFGAGRRICPGLSHGLATVEILLSLLLYHFDWSLPEGIKRQEIDMTEAFGITSGRKNKLYVIPTVKRPLPIR